MPQWKVALAQVTTFPLMFMQTTLIKQSGSHTKRRERKSWVVVALGR